MTQNSERKNNRDKGTTTGRVMGSGHPQNLDWPPPNFTRLFSRGRPSVTDVGLLGYYFELEMMTSTLGGYFVTNTNYLF